jgi:hypothetical protein
MPKLPEESDTENKTSDIDPAKALLEKGKQARAEKLRNVCCRELKNHTIKLSGRKACK